MPGDDWQKFANLRALLGYQWLFPGKNLLFMGGEFGQGQEWGENRALDWWLLEQGPHHAGAQRFLADLNQIYRAHPALWEADYDVEGFQWVDCSDTLHSVLSFLRRTKDGRQQMLVVLHLTPELRTGYRIGLPSAGSWREVLNSDAAIYGGSNHGNLGIVTAEEMEMHGQPCSGEFTLPPLSVMVFVA